MHTSPWGKFVKAIPRPWRWSDSIPSTFYLGTAIFSLFFPLWLFLVADNHNTIPWLCLQLLSLATFNNSIIAFLLPFFSLHHLQTHFKFIKFCRFCYHLPLLMLDKAMRCQSDLNDKACMMRWKGSESKHTISIIKLENEISEIGKNKHCREENEENHYLNWGKGAECRKEGREISEGKFIKWY